MENAKIQKFICDILSNFQELSMTMTGHEHKKVLGHGCMKSRLSQFFRLVVPENVPYNCYCKQSIESSGADFQNENFVYVSHVLFFPMGSRTHTSRHSVEVSGEQQRENV